MGKIRKLDDALANKIAAGEVVERPASVVKELVENAIDAHSTIIEVELEEAGLAKIRVVDNGDGFEEEDCFLAFERHATSKIKDEADLFRIRTLGFRGEALPSIASVSHLELKTSTGEGPGTWLVLKGGELVQHGRTSSRKGTDITVSHLFFNTPARLKYMKTIHTELGHVVDVINRLALAHPHISFRLTHNGKQLFYTNGNGDVRQVLAAIYGLDVAKKMIAIHAETLDFTIDGYVALPEVTRASRNYMTTIVNGRYIKNYSLYKAIEEGYHTLLPIGRHPITFLNIMMDPLLIDVNVHPAKLEVRFSKEAELNELVQQTIRQSFQKKTLIPEVTAPRVEKTKAEQQTFSFEHIVKESNTMSPRVTEIYRDQEKKTEDRIVLEKSDERVRDQDVTLLDVESVVPSEHVIEEMEQERIPPLYPIGQMHGTYILAQNENGLYIIDQHAAQERIKYEYFREKLATVTNELQPLLIPLTLTYSSSEYVLIESYRDQLAACGVFLEPFGHNSFIVRSHPQWFPKGEELEIIEEMIKQVLTMKKVDIKQLREKAAIMMSCKQSIKANQFLRNDEIFALLESLRKTSDPFTCPHGRPIIIHFSTYELEKMFKRVM
ncbi:DNA mismatch repair endonuclease MutL [Anoxybacillus sp. LAT_35]|uniref:DNA mismatch repair endonuclease MutL n=1 Tax=Anoxybacillus TaxID=150247 RepID=UPI001EDC5B9F|nr:DNA mismatch repair endonuclease MutL [Anoxybacillus sp. LAT_26]MCG3083559.1 DNA mismatch repair endonuclease MutL [Anoxybacillus sp. LAT27]MCG5025104.1 DNA mismatch repair endonuclease MutL [Anoxybacillus flavithermus]MCG6170338.1 DNA mismatch repair endonuclease MutL [Anoxybacillus sp. LAT_11]MCG6174869.1 DNA mismatch repair endonuclease MutL [Anoxybacillus sp. LAT_31]MCG6178487.1 DNA mismatch repair endonuclease MutL [Anoxybacillus sp. LAT_35]MCG6179439.1 DNA mismatch repair endonucleas